jgi:hypothetical protein
LIPTTLLGLVVFAASLAPGYVWTRVAEVRLPRHQRTQLLEAAELVFIGSAFSAVAFSAVYAISLSTSLIDADELAASGTDYFVRHPWRATVPFAGALLAASALAGLSARVLYRTHKRTIRHGYSAWHWAMRDLEDRVTYATVDLRDGTSVAGVLWLQTAGDVPVTDRELVLARVNGIPLSLKRPGDTNFYEIRDQALLIQGPDVLNLAVNYLPRPDAKVATGN